MTNSGSHLRTAEIVRRLGVSGKALRLYEARGLIRAERTPAGWRVYGPEQIARLHQVLALRSYGFSLGRIAAILSGRIPDLATFLDMHEQVLRQEAARVERALRMLSAARAKHAGRSGLSPIDLLELTRETLMNEERAEKLAAVYAAAVDKHLSEADQAALAAKGYQGMHRPDADWDALHEEAAQLMKAGDPSSPAAMDLARRWMGKVFEGTGGDPALTMKMKTVAREVLSQPVFQAASSSSIEMMDFVSQAYGAAIRAGLMPNPVEAG